MGHGEVQWKDTLMTHRYLVTLLHLMYLAALVALSIASCNAACSIEVITKYCRREPVYGGRVRARQKSRATALEAGTAFFLASYYIQRVLLSAILHLCFSFWCVRISFPFTSLLHFSHSQHNTNQSTDPQQHFA